MNKCGCGCGADVRQRFVSGHNRRGRHFPDEDYSTRKGENHYAWKGGRPKSSTGYILNCDKKDPNAYNDHGHRYDHRVVMAQYLGRQLTSDEIIHHINGNKLDNRIENLEIVTRGQHNTIHFKK